MPAIGKRSKINASISIADSRLLKQTAPSASLAFKFVDYRHNLLATASRDIIASIESHRAALSAVTLWCESNAYAHALRQALLAAAQNAQISSVLLPTIAPLRDWMYQHHPAEQPLINEANKQLLLMEAIRQFPTLFKTSNAWPVTKELVGLFNECTLAQIPLDDGAEEFGKLLAKGYASPFDDLHNISRESEIIYQLWQAYNQQINARNWIDPIQHYCNCLSQPFKADANQSFYVIGIHRFTQLETKFFDAVCKNHPLTIYYPRIPAQQFALAHHPHYSFCDQNNNAEPDDNQQRAAALDIVYDNSAHTFDRINATREKFKQNPYSPWLSLFTTNSIEKHVNAVCLQTKQWLLEEKFPIGIVSNDRLLTRRIRAVLEDAGICADDLGGWALSTTSAATTIEVLLDAIETSFGKDHLMDLLTNPFLADQHHDSAYLDQVQRVRQLLKQSRSVMRGGISPYIAFIETKFDAAPRQELLDVLQAIQSNSKTLLSFSYQSDVELHQFAKQLLHLLTQLDITTSLRNDAAGKKILATLETSLRAIAGNKIQLSWAECRQWLRDLLEHNFFAPDQVDPRVILCGFDHLDYIHLSAVIVAGVEHNRLHSSAGNRTFFNEKVRQELGLQTNSESEAVNFIRFRQLLEQSNHVLLSAETECRGEAQEISAWVKIIELFSQQAFAQSLQNPILDYLLSEQHQYSQQSSDLSLPVSTRPSPATPDDLIPTKISATQYQTLIDCPYRYFAKYLLNVKPDDAVDDLDASEFGRLVHQSLYDFHFDQNGESNYRDIEFAVDTRDALINALKEISSKLFMRTSFPDAIKRGWLQRWLNNIPAYIDWTIERSHKWHPQQGEVTLENSLTTSTTLQGQIDRLDTGDDGVALIDFKTGAIPTKVSVSQGETVQLPFYALLSDKINQAEYLQLGDADGVKPKVKLNKEELEELGELHRARLAQIQNDLKENAPLAALGTERICRLCDFQGFCRKSHWQTDDNN